MEKDKYSINSLLVELIKPLNLPFYLKFFVYIRKNENYILERYNKGTIEENNLLVYLKKSIFCEPMRMILPDILYLTDPSSVTDNVVRFCVRYPGKFRNTLLSQLAHMWLTITQLEEIYSKGGAPEALYKLFVLYAKDNFCSSNDFELFLYSNVRALRKINCRKLVKEYCPHLSCEKEKILNRFFPE